MELPYALEQHLTFMGILDNTIEEVEIPEEPEHVYLTAFDENGEPQF